MFPDNRTKEHLLRREIITKMLTKGSKQISVAFHLFLNGKANKILGLKKLTFLV